MSDMTQSFIEMVEAFKAKPELEARIKELSEDNSVCYSTIEQLRYTLCDRDATIADLRTKLSEVTKERDDAMFRNLELEDKFGGIEKLLGVAERLEQARQLEHQATVDALTPKPLVEAAVVTEQGSTIVEPSYTGPIDPIVVSPQGQSAADPTMSDGNVSEAGTSIPTEPSFDQYETTTWKNQPYDNKPWWVKDDEWYLAGGILA